MTFFKPLGEFLSEEYPETPLDMTIRKHYEQPCGHGCQCHNGQYCEECHGPRPDEASE